MASPAQIIRRTQRGVGMQRFLGARPRARAVVIADLGPDARAQVASTFIGLLEGLYAHLPLKRSMYAIDPVQRLRLLLQRSERLDPVDFHYEMADVITDLRDAHTRYVGPTEFEGAVAMLPFLVEAYGPPDAPRYVVSKMAADTQVTGSQRYFKPGVEIRTWNAVPMDRAVDRHADDETGGRPDARRARALDSMTLRALQFGPPPDEQWVDIGYVDLAGRARTHRIEWRVVQPRSAATSGQAAGGASGRRFAIDPAAEVHRRVKKLLFKPGVWYQDLIAAATTPDLTEVADGEWIPTALQDALAAKVVTVRGQRLGYLRLWGFDVADDDAYIAEVVRLLTLLPDRGLIIDLRSNPGGLIWAAERMLQLLTPKPVSPNGFSLLATSLTREMAAAPQNAGDLEPWRASLDDAVATGELYSSAVPITPLDRCNDIGQVYGGPVVAIVDPNTYSAGDLFAAGFVDNGLGPLVSVGEATGGGGANVWSAADVADALLSTAHVQQPLPAGIGYTMSVRRATRSGSAAGAAIEDVGVRGDYQHAMTRRDLTDGNVDLLSFAGRIALGQRRTSLSAELPSVDGAPLVVRTLGIDQLDVVVDEAFQASRRLTGRVTKVDLPAGWSVVELRGSADGDLVQRRVLRAG